MELIEVIIIIDQNGRYEAQEVNNSTNPKMGERHKNYESLLKKYAIDNQDHYFKLLPGKRFKGQDCGNLIILKEEV